jgi:hypothetical protein
MPWPLSQQLNKKLNIFLNCRNYSYHSSSILCLSFLKIDTTTENTDSSQRTALPLFVYTVFFFFKIDTTENAGSAERTALPLFFYTGPLFKQHNN